MRRKRKKVTLGEVAIAANVSMSTVSAVINDNRNIHISDDTRDRVLKIAKELGYRQNRIAKAMKTGKSHIVGLLIVDVGSSFYSASVYGVEEVLKSKGYTVIIHNCGRDMAEEKKNIEFLLENQVDGIIIVSGSGEKDNKHLDNLLYESIPFVVINRYIENPKINTITFDNKDGAYRATRHLLEMGANNIALVRPYLDGRYGSRTVHDEQEGYLMALKEAGVNEDEVRIYETDSIGIGAGYLVGKKIIESGDIPKGFIAASDRLAIGILKVLSEHGIKVPQDVKVVGYNNQDLCNACTPTLTSVAQPVREAGRVAAKIVTDTIENLGNTPSKVILPCGLQVRQSTTDKI